MRIFLRTRLLDLNVFEERFTDVAILQQMTVEEKVGQMSQIDLGVIATGDICALKNPLHFIYDFPYGDKAGHFILYGLLNFFITLASIRSLFRFDPKRVALSIGLILALLIGAEEYSQKFFANRTFDLIDLLAGYIGLVAGGWVALKIKRP